MKKESLYDTILRQLAEVELINSRITRQIWPPLAEALEPIIGQYMAAEESFPDTKTFRAMVLNFNQDGPRVQLLLQTRQSDEYGHWLSLREQLVRHARRKWPKIRSAYQEEIADRAWVRIHRYLPNFLFVARFSTWGSTILLREYLRLKPKICQDKQKRSFEEVDEEGRTLAERLPSLKQGLEEKVVQRQNAEHFWARLSELARDPDVKILRLHMHGYKLHEIQRELGAKAPSISTISRRLKRIQKRCQEDQIIREMAQQWGILSS